MFAAVAAWGIAALALARSPAQRLPGRCVAGLLLGCAVMLSYGLPLLGLLAVAVLVVARSLAAAALGRRSPRSPWCWRSRALGFSWWEALPVLHDRYWAGVARNRPPSYWMWGNLAALAFSAGPMLRRRADGAGRERRASASAPAPRGARWLVGGRRRDGRSPPTCRR